MATQSRTLRAWSAVFATLAACREGGRPPREEVPPPTGVVLIVVDTLRADAVIGERGRILVPGLGAMAAEAAVFEACYSHASLTKPSHAALFSSRLPSEAGVVGNHDALPVGVPVLAEWLGAHGFQTLAASSLWLQRPDKKPGLMRGFDTVHGPQAALRWADETLKSVSELVEELHAERPFFLFCHFVDPHFPYRAHGSAELEVELWNGAERLRRLSASQSSYDDSVVILPPGKRTIAFRAERQFSLVHFDARAVERAEKKWVTWEIEQGSVGQPLDEFVVVVSNEGSGDVAVSLQYCVYDTPDLQESRRRYAEEVAYVDRHLSRLFELLAERGLYDESLIVFASDHGEGLGEHGVLGHALNLYDEQVHVPLIVKPPRSNPHLLEDLRERTSGLVGLIDVVPTVLEILRLPALPGQRGKSILGPRGELQFAEGHPPYAAQLQVSVRDERYKLIFQPADDRFFLYDLALDPHEAEDLFPHAPNPRPDWPALLREKAASLAQAQPLEGMDPDLRKELEALGYLGGEQEEREASPESLHR